MLQDEIRAVFSDHPDALYGWTPADYSPYGAQYASALVLAVPYAGQLGLDDYTEEGFDRGIQAAWAELEEIVDRIESLLRRSGVPYWVPPVAQENETELRALFSFKAAAVRAGLGWIGKNDVVITERYGPRVRLSALLIDEIFEYGRPFTKSQCPDGCDACVAACPCKALLGRPWTIDTPRSEIIDYHRCNRMRSAFIPKLGRKSACGLCLSACPIGRRA